MVSMHSWRSLSQGAAKDSAHATKYLLFVILFAFTFDQCIPHISQYAVTDLASLALHE